MPRRLLSEATAREVTLFLSDAQARLPSFPRLGATEFPFPVAVKTGTSSRHRDAWALGWSREHVVGAWVGHADALPMKDLTGHRSAARLVHRVLMDLAGSEVDGLEDVSFPPPRGASRTRLCAMSGALAAPACDRIVDEWISPGDSPVDACSWHERVAVDSRSGLRATRGTSREFVEIRTVVHLPPRLASWGASAKLPAEASDSKSRLAALESDTVSSVAVTSPRDGVRLARDPETPPELATVALEAVVDPPAARVTWYVDGAPFAVARHPYAARWKLSPGEHSFQARLPGGGASRVVRVLVD
jgi:penicillin-binding protein 1C